MIPETLKIGWKEYTVTVTDEDENLVIDDEICFGHINTSTLEIQIAGRFPLVQQKATLLHEAIHGVVDMQNLDLTEDDVTRLANGLYDVMVNNPKDIFL